MRQQPREFLSVKKTALGVALIIAGRISATATGEIPLPPRHPDVFTVTDFQPSVVVGSTPAVRVLYFVPNDLAPNAAQRQRILTAAQDVHRWYADHTDSGKTF